MTHELKRKKFDIRLSEMKNIRQPHEGPLKDIRDYQAPNRGNFDEDKGKEGQRKDLKIYNGSPALAARTLEAGMNAGVTAPSRPWFRLAMANRELMEREDVRAYLRGVEQAMYQIFSRSNFYPMASSLYLELGVFGTAAMSVQADFDDVAIFDTYTIGEYWIATNARKKVDVLYRRIYMTPTQLIEKFGKEKVSQYVRNLAGKAGSDQATEQKIKIIHAVEPNDDRIPNMIDAKNKAYRSVYYEEEAVSNSNEFLSVSGFDVFPYMVSRWKTNGSNPYGTDQPGIVALGDAKQLQSGTFRKAAGLDRNLNPPLQIPADMKNQTVQNVPGGATYRTSFNQGDGIKPLYEVRVPLGDIIQDIQEIENRIRSAYYVDLFLAIQANNRPQDMKAEVAFQIDKERLLMLGPVLESLNEDFLDPLIDRVFELGENAGVFPEAPEDLSGVDLNVEYVSSLAKAQKTAAISNMERLTGLVGLWASIDPGVVDKLDLDQAVDEASEILDVPTSIIRSDDEVKVVREAKQAVANQQIMLQAGVAAAGAAKDLANAPVGTGNMLEQLSGVQAA
jgi:hypothetical protein